jgi:hypothetical protein
MASEPNSPTPGSTLVVQDPTQTLEELMDLDREIQNVDEEIVQRKAALKQVQERREEMVAQLRAKIRAAHTPMPLLALLDGPSTDAPSSDGRPAA